MDSLSDSAWHQPVELAVLSQARPGQAASGDAPGRAADDGFKLFGDDGFTFLDFIDIINPLHHIPVVGTLYRHFTGDEIDPGSRVFGGTLFFGPVGTVASIGDVLIRDATGKDMGQHVMAFFNEQDAPRPPEVAEAAPIVVADVNARSSYISAAAQEPEPLDPVTAWAMEEVAYRQAMAAKMQSQALPRTETRQQASLAMPAVAAAYADSRKALVAAGLAEPSPTPHLPARLAADPAAGKSAQSIIRHTRQSAALYAATTYGSGGKPAEANKRDESARPAGTPSGAVAPLGGWFTDALRKAHDKYEAGAAHAGPRPPATIDLRQ